MRVDGQRSVLLTIQKAGNASTLDVIPGIKSLLPKIKASLPPELDIKPLADQSIFVRASIDGVIKEATIAACLTGLMILIFLGSWRSTLIIAVSIPLSILTSIIVLSALGETINIMTLAGLALAVGILVDDATVEIENINRNIAQGKQIQQAILDGAQQIAVPAFVSTLCICIVFVPMFFLTGVARYLFVPLAESVVFAMLASYLLSRTLVPTMAKYLLRGHEQEPGQLSESSRNPLVRLQIRFEETFEHIRAALPAGLRGLPASSPRFSVGRCSPSPSCLWPRSSHFWDRTSFPPLTAGSSSFTFGLLRELASRKQPGFATWWSIRSGNRFRPRKFPASSTTSGFPIPASICPTAIRRRLGLPMLTFWSACRSDHRPTEKYVHDLRLSLAERFPGVTFSFLPADIVSQILNFGLPAPIDIQVAGNDLEGDRRYADNVLEQVRGIPGTADLRIQQPFDQPELYIDVDRTKANEIGFTQHDVAQNLLVSLSGSFQTSPTFWLDPKNRVSYSIATQTPQYRVQTLQDVENIPVTGTNPAAPPEILGSLASVKRQAHMPVVSHYDIRPVIDIYGSVQGRDLGAVARQINQVVSETQAALPVDRR